MNVKEAWIIKQLLLRMLELNGDETNCIRSDPQECQNHSVMREANKILLDFNNEK